MILLLLILSIQLCIGQDCSSYQIEVQNEGYKPFCYYDSENNPTIGIGCLMSQNKALINQVTDGKYDLLISSGDPKYRPCGTGNTALTDSQVQSIFNVNINTAAQCASKFVPGMPPGPQSAITDMAFNMGCSLDSKWPALKKALIQKDYTEAGYQVTHGNDGVTSKFCKTSPARCQRDKSCMCSASSSPVYCNNCEEKCVKFPDTCCGTAYPNCCQSSCCPAGYPVCCTQGCCPSGTVCCGGNTCCPAGYPVCCTQGCCPSGTVCCGSSCCRLDSTVEPSILSPVPSMLSIGSISNDSVA